MQKMRLENEPAYKVIFEAYDYQREAVNAIKDKEYGAIFHEQGLGKTKIAIDILLYWLNKKMVDVTLIVTKKQLVSNWIGEIKEHTGLNPAVLNSNKNENYYVFNGKNRIIIANFEVLSSERKRFKSYLDILNVGIIIDESAKLKNPESKLTQTYFELSKQFTKRIIMTGTPIANRPYDIWSQIFFLDGGRSLGENFYEFKKYTDLSNDLVKNEEKAKIFEETVKDIYSKISSFTVRETKQSGIISLPDKEYINILVDFEHTQFDLYEKIRKDMLVLIEKNNETLVDDSSASLKRLLRLVQVTSNPKLVDELYFGESAKESELDKLLNSIIKKGEKCIVWSSFIENVDYFNEKYRTMGSVKIHGRMSIESRVKSVDRFKHDSNISILFATPQSAKEGLTLTVANNVIFYDRGFSLDDYLQAQDRIHRISQTKKCYIYNLMISNSIDEWVDILLKAKEQSAKLGQGDINIDEYHKNIDYSFGQIVKNILGGVEDE
ncbi:MAG: DEAD/DEAH box helicase [Bacilli bacterium]